ncbi:lasso peptide biosynthesis B2 protein [Bacillus sp. RAR_GA_16]|uniref:lasso peptide biosynthesis B2 protein n=1 Tax=Bacillus sp. RAR_GA_16 TaxID=2876774 RepID=UPI001CCC3E96|nr:lasso peptide biosynthesis B2 protein [Bacillus sp. RAR_GA_16]MCA0172251.1 lasso peptide biosynthesis B2 protein [Bacillus sp. RAR_GA_16]
MGILKKGNTFITLSNANKFLMIEALLMLGWARILKSIPFRKVAPLLGEYMVETTKINNSLTSKLLKDVAFAIDIMSRNTIWESRCLVKAIAGMKMLERRKIESTLYLGTAKDRNGNLIAHAWLRSGEIYITGHEEMHRFAIVSMFTKKVSSNDKDKGEGNEEHSSPQSKKLFK